MQVMEEMIGFMMVFLTGDKVMILILKDLISKGGRDGLDCPLQGKPIQKYFYVRDTRLLMSFAAIF